jgi:hypothetical protein
VLRERLDTVMQQMAVFRAQLEGIAAVLAPEELLGLSPQEASLRKELAGDALQFLEDAKAAIDSGEPEDVVTALFNAANRIAVQLRDRVLDQVTAANPAPDHWPM